MIKPNIYEIRTTGQQLCQTDGSAHYKDPAKTKSEPIEIAIEQGWGSSFCKANILKYVMRYDQTKNMQDLIKAADYCHILIGLEAYHMPKKEGDSSGE